MTVIDLAHLILQFVIVVQQKETAEHFLLYCSRYKKEREELIFEQLLQIPTKNDTTLLTSESMLLAPQSDNINKH